MAPAPMPVRYIVEMLMDRIAACKVYNKENYSQRNPLEYYNSGKDPAPLHEKTRAMLELFLTMLAQKGEPYTCRFIRREILPRQDKMDLNTNIDWVLDFCKKTKEDLNKQS